jgi:hypothetical protein
MSLRIGSCAAGLLLLMQGTASAAGPHLAPVGSEFQVNSYTTSVQRFPSVAADADGGFVVVWHSVGSPGGDTSDWSIQGELFDSAGNAVAGQPQVNTYTTGRQQTPSVASSGYGDIVVVWQGDGSSGSDTSGYSIQGQRFAIVTPVPSLSPTGLAAAALLVCLAVALALRRA